MSERTKSVVFPVLLITLGVGWLLTALNADPRIYWVPVLGMPVLGLLLLIFQGFDKVTVVIAPFFFACTGFAFARQTGHISVETMLPCLLISLGSLMLAAHWFPVPYPAWLQEPKPAERADTKHPPRGSSPPS